MVKPNCWRADDTARWRRHSLTYRKVAECIDLRWPFLQLLVSVGNDVLQKRFYGGLMELLLGRRHLLLHEQTWIELTRRWHHLLLHIKRAVLQNTKRGPKD